MIDVLQFADKEVTQKLFARVNAAEKITLVTVIPPHRAVNDPTRLTPFAELQADFGTVLDQVLVVDAGTAAGMWRDPVTNLADSLYGADSSNAYGASRGYFIVKKGRPLGWLKRGNSSEEDVWFLQELLSKLSGEIPRPDPKSKPGNAPKPVWRPGRPTKELEAERLEEETYRGNDTELGHTRTDGIPAAGTFFGGTNADEALGLDNTASDRSTHGLDTTGMGEPQTTSSDHTVPGATTPPSRARPKTPWEVLGIEKGSKLDDARKQYRTLMAQYHPDKVAHLAPEFRELAEVRTQQLREAWEDIEPMLKK